MLTFLFCREIDAGAFDDMAAPIKGGEKMPNFVRAEGKYESRNNRWVYPSDPDVRTSLRAKFLTLSEAEPTLLQYTQQFASIYFTRLEVLRPILKEQVQKKGCEPPLENRSTMSSPCVAASLTIQRLRL